LEERRVSTTENDEEVDESQEMVDSAEFIEQVKREAESAPKIDDTIPKKEVE
jgi:hypothetical protein